MDFIIKVAHNLWGTQADYPGLQHTFLAPWQAGYEGPLIVIYSTYVCTVYCIDTVCRARTLADDE